MFRFKIFIIVLFCVACNTGFHDKEDGAVLPQNTRIPLIQPFDLYQVDSVFLPYMPDTSIEFESYKEVARYNLKKGKELYDFTQKTFNDTAHNRFNLKTWQAAQLSDELKQYISFRQLQNEPKSILTISELSYVSPASQNSQLEKRIHFYQTFPENLQKSEAGRRTWERLQEYLFKNNTDSDFDKFNKELITDTANAQHQIGEIFLDSKKFYIISFGASWCGPCRLNDLQLKEWHKKVDTSQIKIVSLSVDKDATSWIRSLLEDELPWQSYLLQGEMNNGMVTALHINSIPRIFLLDGTGKILVESVDIRKIFSFLMALG